MAYSNNSSITTGGTSQNVLAEGHAFLAIVFQNTSDTDMRVRVDATASSTTGEIVYANSSATLNALIGKRISVYCLTTGKTFSYREAV